MLEKLTRVFREVFDNDALVVDDALSSTTLADWDSFSQIKIIIGLEEECGVKFTTEEVLEATSVGVMRKMLAAKGVEE